MKNILIRIQIHVIEHNKLAISALVLLSYLAFSVNVSQIYKVLRSYEAVYPLCTVKPDTFKS